MDSTRLELVTSAMRRQHDRLLEISRVCNISANKPIVYLMLFLIFQDIRLGCCTVATQNYLSGVRDTCPGPGDEVELYSLPHRCLKSHPMKPLGDLQCVSPSSTR